MENNIFIYHEDLIKKKRQEEVRMMAVLRNFGEQMNIERRTHILMVLCTVTLIGVRE